MHYGLLGWNPDCTIHEDVENIQTPGGLHLPKLTHDLV